MKGSLKGLLIEQSSARFDGKNFYTRITAPTHKAAKEIAAQQRMSGYYARVVPGQGSTYFVYLRRKN